jgi:hypothetical protein
MILNNLLPSSKDLVGTGDDYGQFKQKTTQVDEVV